MKMVKSYATYGEFERACHAAGVATPPVSLEGRELFRAVKRSEARDGKPATTSWEGVPWFTYPGGLGALRIPEKSQKLQIDLALHGEVVLDPYEVAAVEALKAVAAKWPKTLMLFSWSGSLHVLKPTPGRAIGDVSMATINIENDGGDPGSDFVPETADQRKKKR